MRRLYRKWRRAGGFKSNAQRKLRVESLEPRLYLAADTILVNFQSFEAPVPHGYLADIGQIYGDRGNGLSYGWSSDHTDQGRDRNFLADQRLDTLVHFEVGQNWEIELPDGQYEVTVAVGDPSNNDGVHTIQVEGVSFWDAVVDSNSVLTMTQQVSLGDGRLTVDQGAAADKATRINYIHIVGLADGPNAAPSAPAILSPATDGEVVEHDALPMEVSGFSDSDGDTHRSTDWEISVTGTTEPIWQSLGIEGDERLDVDLGDGLFINSHAGTGLIPDTDYQLRVRFRDTQGSVSDYAVRSFHTAEESSSPSSALEVQDVADSPAPNWEDRFGAAIELPAATSILTPADPIIAIDLDFGDSSYPGNESPDLAIDGTLAKYLNFGEIDSGFIVTPSVGPSIVTSFQITTANDAEERDPDEWELYGTNDPITSTDNSTGNQENWVLIDSGTVSLPSARNTAGPAVAVDNLVAYTSYRFLITGVKNAPGANSMQLAEIQFFGDDDENAVPPSLRLEAGASGDPLLEITATDATGNLIDHFPPLATPDAVRVVIEAGSRNFVLDQSDLTFSDDQGVPHTIFLPEISLAAEQRLDLWVNTAGSTYFGDAAETEPDFSNLARAAVDPNVPFVATQPGFVVEQVGSNYRLPVNIAFVPNPGPNPDDPLYYVTELYGSIQVVTRDGTKHEFATGLLDYNPQGPISGSGEQGLTGITVVRDAENPEIYTLYVSMLWDNGSPPGGEVHYPKVERIDSAPGGLSIGSRTVLLNMQPETQGQSHQISNVSIGPDGKLYVHNGEGFNASVARDLDSFRGKVLRMNLDGSAPNDNPFYNAADGISARDYIFAYGFRNPFGGAWRASDGMHYEVENGPGANDRFAQVNEGVDYGWTGSAQSMLTNAIYTWTAPHAPVNITFIQPETFHGSQFPAAMMDHAFVSESGPTYAPGPQARGKRVVEFALDARGDVTDGPNTLVEYVGSGQSSVVGLAAGPDGLYFTELYEESGGNGPTASGARIFRIRYVNPLAGDYDINGVVDENDYDVWKGTYGSNLLLAADGNGNGVVDAGDYTVWRDNQGSVLAAAATAPPAVSSVTDESTAESSAAGSATNFTLSSLFEPTEQRRSVRASADESVAGSAVLSHVRSNALNLLVSLDRRSPAGAESPHTSVSSTVEAHGEAFADWDAEEDLWGAGVDTGNL